MYISNVAKRLRALNQPTDNDRKRWIWELIQNAKDSIAGDQSRKVDISIEICEDIVKFKHNGKPFTMDARFGLLWKYSEDKENQESTGRFGTGFLTTHCLSKIVDIESDVYDDSAVRGFSVTMYRDGQTEDELLNGLDRMKASEKWYADPFGWTTYTYHVNSDSGRRAIELGTESFRENIARTMLFCKELGSVSLNNNGHIYSITRESVCQLPDGINEYMFILDDDGNKVEKSFLVKSICEDSPELSGRYKATRKLRIDAALETMPGKALDGEYNRLSHFCSLPLVGVEDQLDSPIIINSPDFEPHEERNRLLLDGINWNEECNTINEIGINQMIFKKSLPLYESLVKYVTSESYGNLHLLARGLRSVKEIDNLDKKWFEENVVKEYRSILMKYNVVKSYADGTSKKIGDCTFIKGGSLDKENEIFSIATGVFADKLVADNHSWASVLWKDGLSVWNLDDLCKAIEGYGNWDKLGLNGEPLYTWYNNFLSYVKTNDENLLKEYALLPDFNGDMKSKDAEGFKEGESISNFVISLLNDFGIDKKSELLHSKITAVSLESKYNSISFSTDIDKAVRTITENSYKSGYDKRVQLMKLLAITPDNVEKYGDNFISYRKSILQVMSDFFSISDVEPIIDNSLNKKAWENVDKWVRTYFLENLGEKRSLNGMPEGLGSTWISDAMRNIEATTDEMNSYAVLPDQNGTFRKHSDLYADGGIPECLKSETLKKIAVDYKSCLLDKDVNCDSVKKSKTKKISDIVSDIRDKYICTSSRGWYSCYEWFDGSYHRYPKNTLEEVALYLCSILPANNDNAGDTPDWSLKQYKLQKVARAILPETSFEDNDPIDYDQDNLWSLANKYALGAICRKIESMNNLSGLSEHMNACGENEAVEILNQFHKCGGSGKTFPNQEGAFFEISDLKKDDGTISDEIKDIIKLISEEGKSFRDILVDRRCEKQPESTLGSTDAYKYIDDTVDAKFKVNDNWTDGNFKNAVQLLVEDWAEKHGSVWNADNFPKIYSKKDSLLMNVVWTKEERQSIQRMKTALTAESINFIIENPDIIRSYPAKVKELEDEISRLRKLLGYVEDDTTMGAEAAGSLTGEEIEKLNLEARQCVKEIMEKKGFVFTDGIGKYSVIDGVIKDNAEYPLVVKSCMSREKRIYMNPSEWEQLCKENSMLWLYFGNGVAKPVKAYDLFSYHDKLSLSFGTMNFRDTAKVSTLMNAFKYLGDVHLNLAAMNPFTETRTELESYLFNSNNALNSNTELESDGVLPQ